MPNAIRSSWLVSSPPHGPTTKASPPSPSSQSHHHPHQQSYVRRSTPSTTPSSNPSKTALQSTSRTEYSVQFPARDNTASPSARPLSLPRLQGFPPVHTHLFPVDNRTAIIITTNSLLQLLRVRPNDVFPRNSPRTPPVSLRPPRLPLRAFVPSWFLSLLTLDALALLLQQA